MTVRLPDRVISQPQKGLSLWIVSEHVRLRQNRMIRAVGLVPLLGADLFVLSRSVLSWNPQIGAAGGISMACTGALFMWFGYPAVRF